MFGGVLFHSLHTDRSYPVRRAPSFSVWQSSPSPFVSRENDLWASSSDGHGASALARRFRRRCGDNRRRGARWTTSTTASRRRKVTSRRRAARKWSTVIDEWPRLRRGARPPPRERTVVPHSRRGVTARVRTRGVILTPWRRWRRGSSRAYPGVRRAALAVELGMHGSPSTVTSNAPDVVGVGAPEASVLGYFALMAFSICLGGVA